LIRDQNEANLVEEKTAEVRHELDTALRSGFSFLHFKGEDSDLSSSGQDL
jgi:hypothetical protein